MAPGPVVVRKEGTPDSGSGSSGAETVSARAVEDTKIIKLPFSAFKIAFEKYPDAYLRVVQIVMIR